MTNKQKKLLVTTALTYANGALHLGHMVEQIQCDIWVRYNKLIGHNCIFIGGEDAHGTPIMLSAAKQNITPEQLIDKCYAEHSEDLKDFYINYDNFYTTHSDENKAMTSLVFNKLKENGDIVRKEISQLFDTEQQMFLPDRYVKGECPKCKAKDQYGDNCEICGTHYNPTDLINPKSVLSGTTPVEKKSEHLFFALENYTDMLKNWTKSGTLQKEIAKKLGEWFEAGLKPWDISRDAPYFGFEIPGEKQKYFYVWLDAPIGYLSIFQNLCTKRLDLNFDEYWRTNPDIEIYHFIGKDIVYFHALFWPAELKSCGFKTPHAVFAHGFLTVNGEKMSKSRGTFITTRSYLNNLDPEYLRYYYACKLGSSIEDIDLNLEDFVQRVNSDLIGKFVNLASRSAKFINNNFTDKLSQSLDNQELVQQFIAAKATIFTFYQAREYNKAIKEIMTLADLANQYIDSAKPWVQIKDPNQQIYVHNVCTTCINLFKILAAYLKPVLPKLAKKIELFLQIDSLDHSNLDTFLLNQEIGKFAPLIQRIETQQVDKMLEENKSEDNTPTNATNSNIEPIAPTITIDDFAKIDLRIAKIVHAEHIPDADKLVKLELDVGLETRQVFSGIKSAYRPEDLIGKYTVVVANLAPRKMKFGVSAGMILAASGAGKDGLWLLEPHAGAKPGMRVK
jgi:methionyl-tRNA synthetase